MELADPDLVEQGRTARRAFQRGLGSSRRRRESSSACAVRRLVFPVPRAVLRERADRRGAAAEGRLPPVRSSEPAMGRTRSAENRSDTELMRIQESIYTPGPNIQHFRVSWHFSVRCCVTCKFEAVNPAPEGAPIQAPAASLKRCPDTKHHCGGEPLVSAFRRRSRVFVILGGVAVSLEHAHNLAKEAFLFLCLFFRPIGHLR